MSQEPSSRPQRLPQYWIKFLTHGGKIFIQCWAGVWHPYRDNTTLLNTRTGQKPISQFLLGNQTCAFFASNSRFVCPFQAALDTALDSPFSATLSVHGLHFTVCAPSKDGGPNIYVEKLMLLLVSLNAPAPSWHSMGWASDGHGVARLFDVGKWRFGEIGGRVGGLMEGKQRHEVRGWRTTLLIVVVFLSLLRLLMPIPVWVSPT